MQAVVFHFPPYLFQKIEDLNRMARFGDAGGADFSVKWRKGFHHWITSELLVLQHFQNNCRGISVRN